MKRAISFLLVNAISLYLVSLVMKSVNIGPFSSLIVLTLIFGLLNLTVKPILELLSLPITFLSFGLFSLVINGLILKFAFALVPGAHLSGMINAIIAALLLTIVNTVVYSVID